MISLSDDHNQMIQMLGDDIILQLVISPISPMSSLYIPQCIVCTIHSIRSSIYLRVATVKLSYHHACAIVEYRYNIIIENH